MVFSRIVFSYIVIQAVLDLQTGYIPKIHLEVDLLVSWNSIFFCSYGQCYGSKTKEEVVIRTTVFIYLEEDIVL